MQMLVTLNSRDSLDHAFDQHHTHACRKHFLCGVCSVHKFYIAISSPFPKTAWSKHGNEFSCRLRPTRTLSTHPFVPCHITYCVTEPSPLCKGQALLLLVPISLHHRVHSMHAQDRRGSESARFRAHPLSLRNLFC